MQTTKELHEQRKKMWDASISNHTKFIDPSTNLFSAQCTEHRDCPVCAKDNSLFLFNKEGGSYVKCKSCEMVYLNPVFKDTHLEEYYRLNHDIQGEIVASDSDFYISLYSKGLKSIEKYSQRKNILDIGCSSGIFLDLAKKNSWKTYGVELNELEAQYSFDKGHQIHNKLLEEIDFSEPFDAITLWDVFEHLKEGKKYLNMLKKLLSSDGVVFLQIPSSDSLAAKILHEKCNMYDGLEHVNLYSHKSLKMLALECGYEILDIQTVISEIGVINNHLNYENPYFGDTTNKTDIYALIDEETLHKKLLGYKFQVTLGVKK